MTFSVVVAWRGSADELRQCLRSLDGQPIDQIIVSPSVEAESIPGLAEALSYVEWLPATPAADLPELFWGALNSVTGVVVGFLESPSVAAPDWAAAHRSAHAANPDVLAVGGAVRLADGASRTDAGWYWSEFSPYTPGRKSEFTRDLTDANVSYRRSALVAYEAQLAWGYWGWRLRREATESSYFLSAACVVYMPPASFGAALRDRYGHGSRHAIARGLPVSGRIQGLLITPVLPLVLTWRDWRSAARAGHGRSYVAAIPWSFLFRCAWSLGESRGYLRGN